MIWRQSRTFLPLWKCSMWLISSMSIHGSDIIHSSALFPGFTWQSLHSVLEILCVAIRLLPLGPLADLTFSSSPCFTAQLTGRVTWKFTQNASEKTVLKSLQQFPACFQVKRIESKHICVLVTFLTVRLWHAESSRKELHQLFSANVAPWVEKKGTHRLLTLLCLSGAQAIKWYALWPYTMRGTLNDEWHRQTKCKRPGLSREGSNQWSWEGTVFL